MEKLSITELSEHDRPREKFVSKGPEALTEPELLAILIGSGNTKENAVTLMSRLYKDCGNRLSTLGQRSLPELMEYDGIGEAKAITILAACELGRRRQREDASSRLRINSANDLYQLLHPEMQDLDTEEAWVVLLNQNFRLIKSMRLSRGGFTETAVDVRQIIKYAVINNATVVALAHNHPSNNPSPSSNDDRITQQVKKACDIMRIHLLDHVIVTDGKYYSYQEQGRL